MAVRGDDGLGGEQARLDGRPDALSAGGIGQAGGIADEKRPVAHDAGPLRLI